MNGRVTDLGDGAEIELIEGWIEPARAAAIVASLEDEVPWRQETIRIAGREILQPRLSCWIGDPEARYVYSGLENVPRPWTPATAALRHRLEAELGCRFNSVLANLYRGERDSMGWHADDEPELGDRPTIASLSLGATRRFRMRHKKDRERRLELALGSGSLLVMRGTTQRWWKHAVPKERQPTGPRINLTYRLIDRR